MRRSHRLARPAALAALIALVPALAAAPPAAAETYGGGVTLAETTSIEALAADPEAWAGKRVRVEGRVAAVCPLRGCWMELAAGDGGPVVRIKVDDGVIVFPAGAAGRAAAAEGVVRVVELAREDYLGWLAHLAEERGETFDPEAAGVGDGPFRLIQIHATGAEIAPADAAAGGEGEVRPAPPDPAAAGGEGWRPAAPAGVRARGAAAGPPAPREVAADPGAGA